MPGADEFTDPLGSYMPRGNEFAPVAAPGANEFAPHDLSGMSIANEFGDVGGP